MQALQVIPSSQKEAQWHRFIGLIDSISPRKRPVSLELRLLHHIFSSEADYSALYNEKAEYLRLMRIVDMSSALFADQLKSLRTASLPFKIWIVAALMEEHAQEKLGVRVEFAPMIRGCLRAYGRRQINGSGWETVYASPAIAFRGDGETKSSFPPAYFPPSADLPEVWLAMCRRYDRLVESANNLPEKLLAESFLQLIGEAGVHPFMDANKRTFMEHLALLLEREGIRFRDFGRAGALTDSLSDIQHDFIISLLANAGLRLLEGPDEYIRVMLDACFRENYMERLYRGIMAAMDSGIDPAGPYFGDIMRIHSAISDAIRR